MQQKFPAICISLLHKSKEASLGKWHTEAAFDALTISGTRSPNTEFKTGTHSLDTATEKLLHPEGMGTSLIVPTTPIKCSHEGMHIVLRVN